MKVILELFIYYLNFLNCNSSYNIYLFCFLAILGRINPSPINTIGVKIFKVIWKIHSELNVSTFLGKIPIKQAKAVNTKHQTPTKVATLSLV